MERRACGMCPLWPRTPGIQLITAAEALSGTVNDTGSIVVGDRPYARLLELRNTISNMEADPLSGAAVLQWLFRDPWERTISPLSEIQVKDYITD